MYQPGAALPDMRAEAPFAALLRHGFIDFELVDAAGNALPRRWKAARPMKHGHRQIARGDLLPEDVESWSAWSHLRSAAEPAVDLLGEPYWAGAPVASVRPPPVRPVLATAALVLTEEEQKARNQQIYGISDVGPSQRKDDSDGLPVEQPREPLMVDAPMVLAAPQEDTGPTDLTGELHAEVLPDAPAPSEMLEQPAPRVLPPEGRVMDAAPAPGFLDGLKARLPSRKEKKASKKKL